MAERVLVTGADGFIGSWVVDAFATAGYSVLGLDIRSPADRRNPRSDGEYVVCDLRDGDIEGVIQRFRPNLISHHAAQASVPGSVKNPVGDAMLNIVGSLRLMDAARRHGVRKIIYAASGGSTYGVPRYLPIDEAHPLDPVSPYAVSKHTVEHYLRAYQFLYGMAFTSLRYANVYGPRQDPHGEAGVIAIFSRRMLGEGDPIINGDGLDDRDYVFVGDVAEANVAAATRGDNECVNIGSGVGTNVVAIFERLRVLTGYRGARIHGPPRAGDVPSVRLDPARAAEVLAWSPRTTFEEGTERTVAWFRDRVRAPIPR
ncbi:MAG: NAD-dependent epimerase/dehydratase family protein [Chloroflexi bacterium]|nr:NAD-dependent epimerase/dehydratase family protein [Chloroflexota bacterium]